MADSERTVTTQAEVDHAIADKAPLLIVRGGTLLAPLILWGNSHAELRENSHAVLWGNSHAVLRENSHAVLWGNSHAVLWGNSHAVLRENSHAVLWGNSHAELSGNSHAELSGNSHAELSGNSHAVLRENSHAVLWGNSHAELSGNSHAVLRENSHAVLRENSHAVLWENSHAELSGNSHAELSRYAVAHQMPHHKGTVAGGGTVIVVPPIRTPQDWCDYYGVTVTDGVALVFKGVNQEYQSPRGTAYIPLLEVEAEDWDGGAVECGEGLHFSPAPALTHEFLPTEWLRDRAVKYVACGVKLEDMAIHPNGAYPHKCKARRCLVLYECDRRGEPVTGDPR